MNAAASSSLAFCILALGFHINAMAHDSRCDSAPYTVIREKYQLLAGFITKVLGHPKPELIQAICRMRFNGDDRSYLYDLGITDEQIDETETGKLVLDVLDALHKAP